MTPIRALASVEPLSLIFKLNNGLVDRAFDGLTDDDLWTLPAGGGNPMAWILGHVTEARAHLLGHLGAPFETGWGTLFARGESVVARNQAPERAVLESAWKTTHSCLRDAFATLTSERLDQPSPANLPGAGTVATMLGFYAFHESYHVGQLGYVRKLLGHSAIAG